MLIYFDKFIIISIFNYLKEKMSLIFPKTTKKFSYLIYDDFLWKKLLKIHYKWI